MVNKALDKIAEEANNTIAYIDKVMCNDNLPMRDIWELRRLRKKSVEILEEITFFELDIRGMEYRTGIPKETISHILRAVMKKLRHPKFRWFREYVGVTSIDINTIYNGK